MTFLFKAGEILFFSFLQNFCRFISYVAHSDSELIWSDDKDRKYISNDISKYFIYELADALKVVVYEEALMQEIEDKYKAEAKTLKERIKELSVENSTNLNHCNMNILAARNRESGNLEIGCLC